MRNFTVGKNDKYVYTAAWYYSDIKRAGHAFYPYKISFKKTL